MCANVCVSLHEHKWLSKFGKVCAYGCEFVIKSSFVWCSCEYKSEEG